MLTNIEKEAEWIKKERTMLLKTLNEIARLCFTHSLNSTQERYSIHLDVSGNRVIEVRIHSENTNDIVEQCSLWGLDRIFVSQMFYDTSFMKARIKEAKAKLTEMKKIVQKYIKLNEQCQQK